MQQDRMGTDSWSQTAAAQQNSAYASYVTQAYRPPKPFMMMDYAGMRVTQEGVGGDSMRDIDKGTMLQRGEYNARRGQDGGRDTDQQRFAATVPCMARGFADPGMERDIAMGQYSGSRRASAMQQSEQVMHSRVRMPIIAPVAKHISGRGQNMSDAMPGWERGGVSSRDMDRDK